MTNAEPGTGRSPYAARKHDHHNPLAGGRLVPTEALAAAGTASTNTFLRGDDTWAEIPVSPVVAPVAGFNPNEDPVIIGAGAYTDDGATPDVPVTAHAGVVVIGHSAHSSDSYSVAVGWNAGVIAGADEGVAVGANSAAIGHASVALGSVAEAVENAVAIGPSATAGGIEAVGIGFSTTATGVDSVAVGGSSSATADSAVAIGNISQATAANAVALGDSAVAAYGNSAALGPGATTTKANQVMIGSNASFAEIPAGNGLVLTDTVTGVRKLVSLTSGALTLSAAP